MQQILVVEDDVKIAQILIDYLRASDYGVTPADISALVNPDHIPF